MNLKDVSALDEDGARALLEKIRWPTGPACAHCGDVNVVRLAGKATRPGVFKCKSKGCRKQFTVTVGTIFESSHIPLRTWLMAFALLCGAKKSMSAKQMQRALGLGSYQAAWHMAHRIRHAMRAEPLQALLRGVVESDEVWIGAGKPRRRAKGDPRPPITREEQASKRVPVMTMIERTSGQLRRRVLRRATHANIKAALLEAVDIRSRLLTDEAGAYQLVGMGFTGGHGTVNHSQYEYAKPDGTHVNSCESAHALVRRAIMGSWHHVSVKHLPRFMDELEWAWNHRRQTDAERFMDAVRLTTGRRLTYASLIADEPEPTLEAE